MQPLQYTKLSPEGNWILCDKIPKERNYTTVSKYKLFYTNNEGRGCVF